MQATKLKIRRTRVSNSKGTWHENKTEAAVHKNLQVKQEANLESQTAPDKLLAIARAAYDAGKDYAGVVVQPMKSATPGREISLPWCLQANERTMPGIDRLAIEIERFYDYAKPTHTETFARRHLIERVRDLVQRVLPEHVLEVFGSERTGLAGATSDIDFRLVTRQKFDDLATAKLPPTSMRRSRALRDLHQLHWRGFLNNVDYDLVELRYARYPLISLQDRQSGLDVQVVLSNDTSLSRQLMKGYMEEYPHLRQLYFLVKTIFDVRGLSDVFKGGFGSYSLFMMIVASLRHMPHPRNDAAGGLINFLKFYRNLDTTKLGVSIEPVSLFDKKAKHVLTDKAKAKIEVRIVINTVADSH
jgi:non-canonical poly(A) RNA polymerase PAPD5/7